VLLHPLDRDCGIEAAGFGRLCHGNGSASRFAG
jgi:hypothetical protein